MGLSNSGSSLFSSLQWRLQYFRVNGYFLSLRSSSYFLPQGIINSASSSFNRCPLVVMVSPVFPYATAQLGV